MLHMLVASIGVVVVVLIAELVLVLFVLNHNSTNHKAHRRADCPCIYASRYPLSIPALRGSTRPQ